MLTQVGQLKVIHIIECVQEEDEDLDEFRFAVKSITPPGVQAAIGFRSAKIILFHDPSAVELEKHNRETRKVSAPAKPNYDEQEETVATRGKKKNGR